MALTPTIKKNDWVGLSRIIRKLGSIGIGPDASPVFVGLTLTGLSTGIVKSTSGVLSSITDNSANWDTAYTDRLKWDGGATGLVAATGRASLDLEIGTDVQAYDAGLTSIAGMAATVGLVKQTADNVFGIDATTYFSASSQVDHDATTNFVANEHIDWTANTANNFLTTGTLGAGDITGTSLKILESAGATYYGTFTVPDLAADRIYTFPTVAGYIPYSVSGTYVAIDNYINQAVLTTSSPTFASPYFTGTLGVGVAVNANAAGGFVVSTSTANILSGLQGSATQTKGTVGTIGSTQGLSFGASWVPSSITGTRTMAILQGVSASVIGTMLSSAYNTTITNAYGFSSTSAIFTGGGGGGVFNVVTLSHYNLVNVSLATGATMGTQIGYYCPALSGATTNWGLAINTNSYINGSLSIGKNTAPAVALDVVGAGLFTATLGVTGLITATGGVQIGIAPTANSTGTVAIVAKDANLSTANAGWLPMKRSDGTDIFLPYWL